MRKKAICDSAENYFLYLRKSCHHLNLFVLLIKDCDFNHFQTALSTMSWRTTWNCMKLYETRQTVQLKKLVNNVKSRARHLSNPSAILTFLSTQLFWHFHVHSVNNGRKMFAICKRLIEMITSISKILEMSSSVNSDIFRQHH